MNHRGTCVATVIVLLGVGVFCAGAQASDLPPGFVESVFATGISGGTAMEFAPDGRIFVSQQTGEIRVVKDGVTLPRPFATVNTRSDEQGGLLGIVLDPDFENNGYVYVYYTYGNDPEVDFQNRISRFQADPGNPDVALPGETIILDNIEGYLYHNGGAMHFGPQDGMLYIATGDSTNGDLAQDLTSIAGKMLRIRADGTFPPDNPFVGVPGARGEIWAVGLREPFKFAFSSAGDMMIAQVGEDTWEWIDSGVAGGNYGWPICEGFCSPPNSDFIDPVYSYPHDGDTACVIGGDYYEADAFPAEFAGSYLFGDWSRGSISRLTPQGDVIDFAANLPLFQLVDIKVGPEGSLYYLLWDDAGAIMKIDYCGNQCGAPSN